MGEEVGARRSPVALALAAAVLAAALPAAFDAQTPREAAPPRLGKTHVVTSCSRAVEQRFDRAVAMLHSFWFGEAIKEFNRVLEGDPRCAMAYWGIALAHWGFRGQIVATRAGAAAIEKGVALAGGVSPREQEYLAAVALLFRDFERVNPRARITAYEQAMAALTRKYPDDHEAVLFHALAILDTVIPTDKTYAARLRAGAMLEREYEREPDHAGAAHYVIHAYDVPPLAARALTAARRYARLAPDVAHPLHMPSHVFTRLGLWEESIDSNLRSAEAARKEGPPGAGERLHALDYAVYAYLQSGQDRAALEIVRAAPAIGGATGGATAHHAAANPFAAAAIPARYALEREAWDEAAKLAPHASEMPQADAMTHFARALGFARTKRPALAQTEIERLAALRDQLNARRDLYWSEIVDIQRLAATAWTAFAQGRQAEAINLLRSAADREDATEKAGTTPGPLMPAREQLADLLLASNAAADALAAYEKTLASDPNRFRSVAGAAKAAQLAGAPAKAKHYFEQLVAICGKGDRPGRPELQESRRIVGAAK